MWGKEAYLHSFLTSALDGGERSTAGQDYLVPGRGLTSQSLHVFLPYIMNKKSYSTQKAVSYAVNHVAYDVHNIHGRSREHIKECLLGSDKLDIPLKTLEMVCNL